MAGEGEDMYVVGGHRFVGKTSQANGADLIFAVDHFLSKDTAFAEIDILK